MRSRLTAPVAAAIVILAVSACTGADPASPTATAPGPASSASSGAVGGIGGQVDVGVANRFATAAIYGADVIIPTLAGIAVVRTS